MNLTGACMTSGGVEIHEICSGTAGQFVWGDADINSGLEFKCDGVFESETGLDPLGGEVSVAIDSVSSFEGVEMSSSLTEFEAIQLTILDHEVVGWTFDTDFPDALGNVTFCRHRG